MVNNVEDVLGSQYLMFYHRAIPFAQFTPVQTLNGCVNVANQLLNLLGKDFSQWEFGHRDNIAQLLNANWIYQKLSVEPIRKPMLVHRENNQLIVDCGDTRIMALSCVTNPPPLSAVITVKKDQAQLYRDWCPVSSNEQLLELTGFDPSSSTILLTPGNSLDWAITWMEIGDQSTSHHLHDINIRVTMLQNWINQQDSNFQFSNDWVRYPIDWEDFSTTD